jgi:predicted DCC family thiol-disulfide oxidoreductase YuxK
VTLPERSSPVVLYDGECGLCDATVRFVCRRDHKGTIRYAALQSDHGRALLEQHGLPLDLSTVVLLDRGRAWVRSDAALQLCSLLPLPWPLLGAFRGMPRPLRDALYRFVARHRLRWFGAKERCMLPAGCPPERFL